MSGVRQPAPDGHRHVPGALPVLAERGQQEDLVVHREPEQDGEHHHGHIGLDRDGSVEADQFGPPAPLEDDSDHAVGRGDGDEVHDGGLERDQQGSVRHHEQQEGQCDDTCDEVRGPGGDDLGEVSDGRGDATDVGAHSRTCDGHRQDAVTQLVNQVLCAWIGRLPLRDDPDDRHPAVGADHRSSGRRHTRCVGQVLLQAQQPWVLRAGIRTGLHVGVFGGIRDGVHLRHHRKWPVLARSEPLIDEVVGLPGGGLLGQDPVVAVPQGQRQGGGCHHQQYDGRTDREAPRFAGDRVGQSAPTGGVEVLVGVGVQALLGHDPVLHHAEDRGNQGDGGQHGHRHHDGRGVAQPGQEGDPGQHESADGGDQGASSEDHAGAGGAGRATDGVGDLEALVEQCAVACDEEQRVVDAHPEAQHRAQGRGDIGDEHQAAEQSDDGQAQSHREDRADQRHECGTPAAQGDEEDEHGGDEPECLTDMRVWFGELSPHEAADGDGHPVRCSRRRGVEDLLCDACLSREPLIDDHREDRGVAVVGQQGVTLRGVGDGGDFRDGTQLLGDVIDRTLPGSTEIAVRVVEDDRGGLG